MPSMMVMLANRTSYSMLGRERREHHDDGAWLVLRVAAFPTTSRSQSRVGDYSFIDHVWLPPRADTRQDRELLP